MDQDVGRTDRGTLTIRDKHFRWGEQSYVMGILNITPDSFSGDGVLSQSDGSIGVSRAVTQAEEFVAAGADILDVGGESTRPGATPVSGEEEQARVVPVIAALRAAMATPISVDTWKSSVAMAALDAGADLVNDIWGLRLPEGGWNRELAGVVAERGVPIVLMHNRRAPAHQGPQGGHYRKVHYDDLLGEVLSDLRESVAYAEAQGIKPERIIIDPGIGFGKTPGQNIELLQRLHEFTALGLPLLVGTSRKSFIGLVLNLPPEERVEGTAATVALAIQAGADIVRVHDVGPLARVVRMTDAIVRSARPVSLG